MDRHLSEVLSFISGRPSGATFYELVRAYGFPDAPIDVKTCLTFFIENGLVELHGEVAGANSIYRITEKGREASGS